MVVSVKSHDCRDTLFTLMVNLRHTGVSNVHRVLIFFHLCSSCVSEVGQVVLEAIFNLVLDVRDRPGPGSTRFEVECDRILQEHI